MNSIAWIVHKSRRLLCCKLISLRSLINVAPIFSKNDFPMSEHHKKQQYMIYWKGFMKWVMMATQHEFLQDVQFQLNNGCLGKINATQYLKRVIKCIKLRACRIRVVRELHSLDLNKCIVYCQWLKTFTHNNINRLNPCILQRQGLFSFT